jgi:hypothetical protein
LPGAECRTKRLGDQVVTGIEVLVKAAHGETDLLH